MMYARSPIVSRTNTNIMKIPLDPPFSKGEKIPSWIKESREGCLFSCLIAEFGPTRRGYTRF
jgi:hypothetical protein